MHLFDPPDAMRSVDRGVSIDYYLKNAAEKVTIDILDAQGQVVNTLQRRRARRKAKSPRRRRREEESFRAPAPRVAVKAGMNRFVWDMRYADAKDFPKMILWAGSTRGPLALPGTYQVRPDGVGRTTQRRVVRDLARTRTCPA